MARGETSLSRAAIVQAALDVMQRDGLDRLSMRTVADALSVKAPALYWHIGDKAELLSHMAMKIHVEAREAIGEAESWRDWLLEFGRALRLVLLRYRDGARLCAIARPPDFAPESAALYLTNSLREHGLPMREALSFQASIISLATGWALFEANQPTHQFIAAMFDVEQCFEEGLSSLIIGYPELEVTPISKLRIV